MNDMDKERPVIETRNLTFSIGRTTILQDVSLTVPKGSIYGFLGPNGAGKTTLIRLLLNLFPVDRQKVFLFGDDVTSSRIQALKRLGRYVEHPSLYRHLTGEENLRLAQQYYQVSRKRVAEVLDIVGMTTYRHRRVKAYSLGMRQRIALGQALLHDPELLILDEPTNGLDPNGIKEIRELLVRLNRDYGKTVFISSHMLSEIEKMCTHVGVINHGRVLYQGRIEDMQQSSGQALSVSVSAPEDAVKVLAQQGISAIHNHNATLQMPIESPEQIAAINRHLVSEGFDVYELKSNGHNLEEVFMSLTANAD